jgi:hypothetical protein
MKKHTNNMQIVEIIQVGDLEGYSIRLGRDKKYYLFSNDIVCVSKGKNTIDEVRSIIKCQDPTLYSLVNKEKQSAVEWLVEELGEYFPHEIGGIHLMVERAKAMEKSQMIDFTDNYVDNCVIPNENMAIPTIKDVEQYYRETYEQ